MKAIQLMSICILSSMLGRAEESIQQTIRIQRACEVAIWGMPAVGMIDFEKATRRDLGGEVNDVVFVSKPFQSRHGFLTANDVTPYAWASLSTGEGPLVIEVPPATEKVGFFGTIVDAWDVPLIDVGTTGHDKGAGARYLLLPPDYTGELPEGYVVLPSTTINGGFAFRPVMSEDATFEDTTTYTKNLKVYALAEAENPPPTRYVDAFDKAYNSLPTYDMTYFEDLNDVIQREPVREQDKAMMALLASIGIEKGKPFEPTPEEQEDLLKGLARAYDWMQAYFTTEGKAILPWWEDRKWYVWNFAEGQPEAGFPYVSEDRILIDERAGGSYFWITYLPKVLGGGTFYLTGLRTPDGEMFSGQDTYKLTVPPDTPANDFWSVIVYSMETKGFIVGNDPVGRSSRQFDEMVKNADGSVNIYFSPQPVEGFESNTIPTGDDFFLLFRLYGPYPSFFSKEWKLDDVIKVN